MADYGRNQLSPGGALVIGIVCEALAIVVILGAVGVLPLNMSPDLVNAHWVGVCAGAAFAFAGGAIIVDYTVAGGTDANGNLPAGTPYWARVLQYLFGLGIVSTMTAMFTWVAFGSGPRHFSGGFALPFVAWSGATGETSGRVAFGAAAVLLWAMLVALGVAGARQLVRERPR